MALKKSELYSSLWQSCDELRGGMDYWSEVMQDDVYQIAAEGWKAEPQRILVKDKKGKERDKGWACDLVPKSLIVNRYFARRQAKIEALQMGIEAVSAEQAVCRFNRFFGLQGRKS